MSIGKSVKHYRKKAGFTQVTLAERANMSRSYIADVEADRYNPSIETLRTIADALNVQVHQLLGEEGNSTPPWATAKDKRDFKKMLEEDEPIMFDGKPISDEDREKIKKVMELIFWDTKFKNKETYGRKKKDD